VRLDRQDLPAAGVDAHVAVAERGVPAVDERPRLVAVVLHPVRQGIEEPEVVHVVEQLVASEVLPVLDEVGVEEGLVLTSGGGAEAVEPVDGAGPALEGGRWAS